MGCCVCCGKETDGTCDDEILGVISVCYTCYSNGLFAEKMEIAHEKYDKK